jgi:synaptotagmin-4
LTLAAILAVAACFCARRVRRQNKKSHAEAASFPFQPPVKPTRAVRSPNGNVSHYLKKSPSPTSIKPLPGVQSPTSPPQTTTTKYSAENEITKNIIAASKEELKSPDQDQTDECGEYGKLGTLVFKLRYLIDRNALIVSVVRCRGLPSRNSNGSLMTDSSNVAQLQNGRTQTATATDPYVKLQLLPDKQHKVKTR